MTTKSPTKKQALTACLQACVDLESYLIESLEHHSFEDLKHCDTFEDYEYDFDVTEDHMIDVDNQVIGVIVANILKIYQAKVVAQVERQCYGE